MSAAIRVLQGVFGRVELLRMDRPLVRHAHSQCHVLIKTGGVDASFWVQGRRCPLNRQTAVLISTWQPHAYIHHEAHGAPTVILALYIEPHWLGLIERGFSSSDAPDFFRDSCVELSRPMRTLADSLAMQMTCGERFGDDALQAQLSELMILVIDAFTRWRERSIRCVRALPYSCDGRIRRAMVLMGQSAGSCPDSDQLAARACLSRAHFFRLFRQQTCLTPRLYSNIFRVNQAIHCLTESREPLNQLSVELGFSTQGHFTRFFQQHTGIAPSQYRRITDVYGADTAAAVSDSARASDRLQLPRKAGLRLS
ncbi:MAG TPA: AraC family transcriptional regulator [Nevskiaceae bacterium]|nr:AraC family transcriptional regulator [Nevskiaceae bacterium]